MTLRLVALMAWMFALPGLALAQAPATPRIPQTRQSAPVTAGKAAPVAAGPTLIDVNSADEKTLDGLPGVGPARAKAIVANRPYNEKQELVSKKAPAGKPSGPDRGQDRAGERQYRDRGRDDQNPAERRTRPFPADRRQASVQRASGHGDQGRVDAGRVRWAEGARDDGRIVARSRREPVYPHLSHECGRLPSRQCPPPPPFAFHAREHERERHHRERPRSRRT